MNLIKWHLETRIIFIVVFLNADPQRLVTGRSDPLYARTELMLTANIVNRMKLIFL